MQWSDDVTIDEVTSIRTTLSCALIYSGQTEHGKDNSISLAFMVRVAITNRRRICGSFNYLTNDYQVKITSTGNAMEIGEKKLHRNTCDSLDHCPFETERERERDKILNCPANLIELNFLYELLPIITNISPAVGTRRP